MKALPLVMNAILAVAVAVLFYFQFANKQPESRKNTVDSSVIDSVSSNLKIAYVNQDSLWDNYKLIEEPKVSAKLDNVLHCLKSSWSKWHVSYRLKRLLLSKARKE
jgi:hypothetical protein